MGNNRNQPINFNCDYCGSKSSDRPSHFKKKVRHFCSMKCYGLFRKELRPKHEHERWQGGVSQTEAHRRWKKKNPERMAHLKARRYARERNAEGSHTFEQWEKLKEENNYRCKNCGEFKPLTKDHITPLSEGGTDYIENIQPLCRNCNSKKWKKIEIYQNPELLK